MPKESPGCAGLGGTFWHSSTGRSPGRDSEGGNTPLVSWKGLAQPRHRCQALLRAATRVSPSPSPSPPRHLMSHAEPWPGETCGPKRARCLRGGSGAMGGHKEAPRQLLGTAGPPGRGRTERRAPGPRPRQWRRIPRRHGDHTSRAAKPPNQRLSSCPSSSRPRPSCLRAPDWLTAFPLGWDWRLAGGTPPPCRRRVSGASGGCARRPAPLRARTDRYRRREPPRGLCRCPP